MNANTSATTPARAIGDGERGSACEDASRSRRNRKRARLCALSVSCFCLLAATGAHADLIWQLPATDILDVTLGGELPVGETGVYTDVFEFERTLSLEKFDPRLGRLDTGYVEFTVNLDRTQTTDARGCEWFEVVNIMDFRPRQDVYPYGPFMADSPRFTGIDRSTGAEFSTVHPPFPDENASSDGAQLMIWSRACPTYPGFWDYCVETKTEPDIDSTVQQALDLARFTGLGGIDYEFYTGFNLHGWGGHWEGTCDAGPWVTAVASLKGFARIRAQYIFAPAVDVFVSDAVNHNVLRFRYDGTDVVREEFVAPGSGGLRYPSGLAFAPDGDLLIASWATTFPFTPSQILRYDGQTGAFRGVFAEHEQLTNPMNMVFGPDGDLYVVVQPSASLQRRERVLRFDGQTGDFDRVFASAPCGYAAPSCELDGAWDLAFGPFGDLYVTARVADAVARFDGATGAYKDIFVDDAEGVRDIVWPEGSSSLFLQEGTQVNEYKIDPSNRDAVFWGTVTAASAVAGAGTAIAMGPEMRLGATITTVPSLFAAGNDGVFYFSPPRPHTGNMIFSRGLGSASDVLVRPHVLQTISRSVGAGDSLVSFAYAGLGVSVIFSQVDGGGTLALAVSEKAPGPGATGFEFLGTYYEFSALDGLSYVGPVQICISVPPYADPNNAEILHWDGLVWSSPVSSTVVGDQVCATFPSLSWFGVALSVAPGDIDVDGDVDRDDLNILLQDRNMTVDDSACGAPCDLDGDGLITVLDARRLMTQCTRPRCATE